MRKDNNSVVEEIDVDKLPRHIAIIMDGNGRWARKRLMPRTMGHRAGMSSLKKTVESCVELKIPVLTVFAFSTENWKRPREEVDYLMKLLVEFLRKELENLHSNNIKINILGDYKSIPERCHEEIDRALNLTNKNSGLQFNIALNYGARKEIMEAVKSTADLVKRQEIDIDDINEDLFSGLLYTGNFPDPDLLIRTAGEMRISNFLLWQIAYSEIVVINTLWPDFKREDLLNAIREYQSRDRRFGGLSK